MNKINVALKEQLIARNDNNIASIRVTDINSVGCIGYKTFAFDNLFLIKGNNKYIIEISADITAFELGILQYILFAKLYSIGIDWFKIIDENNLWKYMKEIKDKK